jgi:HK97 family phage major capsid protein
MSLQHLQRAIHGRLMDSKEAGGGGGSDDLTLADIKDMEGLRTQFLVTHKQIRTFIEKANTELKETGQVAAETKSALRSLTETIEGLGTRLDKFEAKANRMGEGQEVKSLGKRFTDLADYKTIGHTRKARMEVEGLEVKAIVNATGQNQPLVPDQRVPGVITTPNRRMRIRNLLPTGQTTSNLVQFVRENVFTNSAGPQVSGSPTVASENATKPESDITFTLANAAVVTIAHFILASTQVLDDAPMLESYINGRLLYGLALEEEDQILNGDGTVGTLAGLMNQATAFNRALTGTKMDVLRRAITQLQLSEYDPEFIVVNPTDWEGIELTKDTQGRYIIANPQSLIGPTLWGLPVVATNAMTAGQFLVANGTMAAQIWDRMQAAVELSREDSDNFRKNMVTILAEERLALTVYRPTALIKGDYSGL